MSTTVNSTGLVLTPTSSPVGGYNVFSDGVGALFVSNVSNPSGGGSGWDLTGNASDASNFLGTTDATNPLVFKTDSVSFLSVDGSQNVSFTSGTFGISSTGGMSFSENSANMTFNVVNDSSYIGFSANGTSSYVTFSALGTGGQVALSCNGLLQLTSTASEISVNAATVFIVNETPTVQLGTDSTCTALNLGGASSTVMTVFGTTIDLGNTDGSTTLNIAGSLSAATSGSTWVPLIPSGYTFVVQNTSTGKFYTYLSG